MNSKYTPLILVGFLSFCAAAIVGWSSDGSTSPSALEDQTESTSNRTRDLTSSNQSLRNLRGQRSEGARMRSAIEMARNLPSSEIKEWLESNKFDHRSGFAMTLFQKIAFERWSQEEPVEFLAWIAENGSSDYGKHVAAAIKNHPDAFREVLASLKNSRQQSRLLNRIIKDQPELALAELKSIFEDPPKDSHNFQSIFEKLLKTHSAELEDMLTNLEGPARKTLETVIIKRDLKEDFGGTLEQLFELENGFEHVIGDYYYQNQRFIKIDILLARLADFPPSWRNQLMNNSHYFSNQLKSLEKFSNIDWEGAGFTSKQTKKITRDFLNFQAQNKPTEALAVLDNYDFSQDEKRYILKATLYRNRSEEDLANFRNTLTSSEDQVLFDEVIEKKKGAKPANSIKSPDDLVAALADGDDISSAHFLYSWNQKQKDELSTSFQSLDGSDKNRMAAFLASKGNELPLDLRGEAIEHLMNAPDLSDIPNWSKNKNSAAHRAVSGHVIQLMKTDTTKATTWLTTLPDGPIRLQAQKNLAYNWRNYDPEATQQWVESLPAAERTEIESFLKSR